MKMKMEGLLLLGAVGLLTGCTSPRLGTTTLAMTGPKGASFHGSYVQCGKEAPLHGSFPFTFQRVGVSEVTITKSNPDDTIVLAAQSDRHGLHSELLSEAGPGAAGFHVRIHEGVAVKKLLPGCEP